MILTNAKELTLHYFCPHAVLSSSFCLYIITKLLTNDYRNVTHTHMHIKIKVKENTEAFEVNILRLCVLLLFFCYIFKCTFSHS